ncbi:adenine-specific DNA-methyltransferase [Fodinibius roseus]|uniref:site-specific DNA-methyltransferase (adenine-specific) n=1 Tax=Fodinibius roseus TaxID=1194090 RepID=A0A1M5K055_9BACT|nr:site-specific DNA-methyltransferase [Fodinibius roseus]SHG45920.1 adenine-specific DNA-methyltransferase [Fodinibius roseus]
MQRNLLEELKRVLAEDKRLVIDDKLVKNKIVELGLKLDEKLLNLLLSNDRLREHFFQKVNDTFVFDTQKFQRFISNKQFLPDSYTVFKNKIGLSNGDEYLSDSKDVTLAWAYKDCVLEGGQTEEEAKREEIFWNETLAPDQIDRLLDPKVFTNFTFFDNDGEQDVNEITEKNNLVIKGNNLLALHSLRKSYTGKVKLIYIDPPYNTRGAANTFAYNNTFNHSSWLTFMKNRLEVAKHLLRENGIFAVSIDHAELFYLGVMLDEIYGRENRMGVAAVVHNPGGRQDDNFFPTAHENMLFYAKDINRAELNTLGMSEEKLAEFRYKDEYGRYKLRGFRRSGSNSKKEERPGLYYPLYYNPDSQRLKIKKEKDNDIEILPIDTNGIERCWRWGPETLIKKKDKYIEVKKTGDSFSIYIKERESDYEGEKPKTIWDKSKYSGQTGTHELKSLFDDKVFSYPKSPHLIADVLKITTDVGDLVLDFFGGSGTTGSVAHKMGRQYIICEQMDYVESVTLKRLNKAIEGDETGISDDYDWKGGGSFIFTEMQKFNEQFINLIQNADTQEELLNIWNKMTENAFLSYRIDTTDFDDRADEFQKLSLDDQKKILLEILDKNQLYVNYSEMDNNDFEVSESDKQLNHQFYNISG